MPEPSPPRAPDRGEPPAPAVDEALERWMQAFRGPLIGLIASWGAGWREADELAQDAFAEAWLGRARLRAALDDLEAVGAWLRGIAFHLWRERSRRERVRAHEPLEHALAQASQREADGPAEEREARGRLRAAFARLPAAHQTVLRMHYLEESGAREVAALLGLTTKAVERRLWRARKALRALLEQEERGRSRPSAASAARGGSR